MTFDEWWTTIGSVTFPVESKHLVHYGWSAAFLYARPEPIMRHPTLRRTNMLRELAGILDAARANR